MYGEAFTKDEWCTCNRSLNKQAKFTVLHMILLNVHFTRSLCHLLFQFRSLIEDLWLDGQPVMLNLCFDNECFNVLTVWNNQRARNKLSVRGISHEHWYTPHRTIIIIIKLQNNEKYQNTVISIFFLKMYKCHGNHTSNNVWFKYCCCS